MKSHEPTTQSLPEKGVLHVIGTPIGNLQDITLRAISTLKEVSIIAAEDTRRTRQLLAFFDISTKCISCREHNEMAASEHITNILSEGKDVAYVTDAGTPGISDPGSRLVKFVRQAGFNIEPVPGPSAVATAMSVAGFSSSSYHFEGFLPAKRNARINILKKLLSIESPIIFFESPQRIIETLKDMTEVLGDREVFMAREMTKLHETYFSGSITSLLSHLMSTNIKGEFTVVVQGTEPSQGQKTFQSNGEELEILIQKMLASCDMSAKDIVELVSAVSNVKKSVVYDITNRIKNLSEA